MFARLLGPNKKSVLAILCVVLVSTAQTFAATVATDTTFYPMGSTVTITGKVYWANESVQLRLLNKDGSAVSGVSPWETLANSTGRFVTLSTAPYDATTPDTFLVEATGLSSGATASAAFVAGVGTQLNQLQNGTTSVSPQWANGNINTNNSCYEEENSVPFRYFVTGTTAGTSHFFTINMEWTKNNKHAYDYITQYDLTEAGPIATAGGLCGSPSSPPSGCASPTGSFPIPSPLLLSNYTGTIPDSFFTNVNPGFVLDGPGNLRFYNATVDSIGKYYFTGSGGNLELNVKVYFKTTSTNSVGFVWGGHLASGAPSAWGAGMGSGAVSGSPFHMRAKDFDGGGGANQDRSISNGVVCLPPNATVSCTSTDSVCTTLSYSCSAASGAGNYLWSITGGTINSGQGTNTINYTVNGSAGGNLTIALEACNASSSCTGSFCCAWDTVAIPIKSCNSCPTVLCHADTSVFLCSSQQICIPGYSWSDPDNNIVSITAIGGTRVGNTICFTPVAAGVYPLSLIVVDSYGCADTCTTNVTVTFNQPPVATCPGDQTKFVCDLSQICIPGFSGTDPDNNLVSVTSSIGTYSAGQVCFTPVAGVNTIILTATDACGATATCTTNVTVAFNSPPVATCPGDQTKFVCDLGQLCIPGFSGTDPDNNLVSVTSSVGTYSAGQVCFTPVAGVNTIILTATDACGATATCTTTVTVTVNQPPVATCPGDQTKFVCDLSSICIPGFSGSDPDNNLVSVTSSIGTYSAGQVCFTPVAGVNTIILTATDACGATATCTTNVTVTVNQPPVATCPGDQSKFVCDLSPICVSGFSGTDPDDNLVSVASSIGTYDDGQVCFTPVAGVNTIILTATDACGATATCTTNVTVTVNRPPVAICPGDQTKFVCDLSQICIPGFSGTDPDNNLKSITATGGVYNNGQVCFTPVVGVNTIILTAEDSCGVIATCTTTVTVALNRPPVAICPGDLSKFVCDLSQICIPGFSGTDPDNNLKSITATGGVYSGGQVCFTPVVGVNTIILTAEDSCGVRATCTTTVTVTLNSPPVAICPGDLSRFVCDLSQICVPGFSGTDPDNNLKSITATGGVYSNGQVCFTPVVGVNTIILTAEDSCGAKATCTTRVTVTLNTPPVAANPPATVDTSICVPDQICRQFSATDVDGNNLVWASLSGSGTVSSSGLWCFNANATGNFCVTATVSDPCGAKDTITMCYNVIVNVAPVVQFGPDRNISLCSPAQLCETYTVSDPNGLPDIVSETVISAPAGTIVDTVLNKVCYTPTVSGTYTFIVKVTDKCGATDQDTVVLTVIVNTPPIVTMSAERISTLICLGVDSVVCVGYTVSDEQGGVLTETLQSGTATIDTLNNLICVAPNANGVYQVVVMVSDNCGAFALDTAVITVNRELCCPTIAIEKKHKVYQGGQSCVSITMQGRPMIFGGFDFLIAYDASSISPLGATEGKLYDDCDWEYFTYRFGATGNCGNACPSGLIRLTGVAEINNGPYHPSCFGPSTADTTQLASICFLVSNDRTLECQYSPIRFFWTDCGDNALSSKWGDSLFVSDLVFDYNNPVSIDDGLFGFPTFFGTQNHCISNPQPGKPPASRCLDFYNGGIDIICADSIDARGDINLNGLAYEVADAVMFSNYFINGLGAFAGHIAGSTAASDANADGLPLTISDLVFLIRVIVGDASPIPKGTDFAVSVISDGGKISISGAELGAVFMVLKGNVTPVLTADARMQYGFDGTNTRVLVHAPFDVAAFGQNLKGFSGDILNVDAEIVRLEMADVYGYAVKTTLPTDYMLAQNYPNPFNPSTRIYYDLPVASSVTLQVYDLLGQVVTTLVDASQAAGTHVIEWNGRDKSGHSVASGVYFYRLSAGTFTSTRKMILLK